MDETYGVFQVPTRATHCLRCGGGENGDTHSRHCLTNIPGSYLDLASFWYLGFNGALPPQKMTRKQARSFFMGQKTRAKKDSEERQHLPDSMRHDMISLNYF